MELLLRQLIELIYLHKRYKIATNKYLVVSEKFSEFRCFVFFGKEFFTQSDILTVRIEVSLTYNILYVIIVLEVMI